MYSPFVSTYGFDPRTPYNLIEPPLDTNKDSDDVLDSIMTVHSIIIDQWKIAKAVQTHYADLRSTHKEFDVNDKVMLSTMNLKLLNQPSKKFRSRYIGPYTIIKIISSQAYEL